MKLHLGCGSDYLDGYINVDKFDYEKGDTSRRGSKYDVKADIFTLPFRSKSIELILIVHVLEHFYRWDTIDILREFSRVLQAGGKLVVEMPDLDRCIQWYVEGGYDRHGGRAINTPLGRLNKGYTQLYGNQWSRLEYEVHRYVWTKSEFTEVLQNIRFSIEEVTNKTKFHMVNRDMRVIAVK